MRHGLTVAITGHDPRGFVNGRARKWERDPEECESDHDGLTTNEL
jgi:hypothetical protein